MINNIFSKNKEKEFPKKEIIIDFREKNSLVPAELINKNFKINFQELKVGDYLINNTIIERKEINDFAQSILNKRIFKQLEEIKQYENYFLIIEGNPYLQKSLHPNALKGSILSILLSFKVPVLFSSHPKETAEYISILTKKTKKEFSITPSKKHKTKEETKKFILESFPSIGPVTATKLIEKFHSLKNIFTAEKSELEKILKNKTDNFIQILNQK